MFPLLWFHSSSSCLVPAASSCSENVPRVDDVPMQPVCTQSDGRMLADPLQREHFALSLEDSDAFVLLL